MMQIKIEIDSILTTTKKRLHTGRVKRQMYFDFNVKGHRKNDHSPSLLYGGIYARLCALNLNLERSIIRYFYRTLIEVPIKLFGSRNTATSTR